MTEWKDIKGYEDDYEISSDGIVRSKDRIRVDTLGRKRFFKGRVLNPDVAPSGYYRVTLARGRKNTKQFYLHRLIAQHFIPNPNNLPEINHKDGNKLNNSIDNLEWCTYQENTCHAYKHGLIIHVRGKDHPNYGKFGSNSKKSKKIISIDLATNERKEYGSIIETKKDGFCPSEVSRSCHYGIAHKNHIFKFVDMR